MVLKKVLSIVLISIFLISFSSNMAYGMDDVVQGAEGFIESRIKGENPIDTDKLQDTSNYLYDILFTIAVVLALAIGIIIGIQFIMGSAEEQAKVKETLVPYIIGVFVVFASFTIWKIVVTIGNDVSDPQYTKSEATNNKQEDQTLQNIRERYNKIINKSEAEIRGMNSLKLLEFKSEIETVMKDLYDAKNKGLISETNYNEMLGKITEKSQIVNMIEMLGP